MISPTGTPPTGVDPAEIDRRWRSRWGERIPATARIGARWGDDAEAVRVLPEPRRYPCEDGDYERLVAKVLTVTQAVLGSPVVLVTHGWLTDGAGRPARASFVADHSPDAQFWRTDDQALEPGFRPLVHSFVQLLDTAADATDVIGIHACDSTDDVFFTDPEFRTLVILRNGWVDVVPSREHSGDRHHGVVPGGASSTAMGATPEPPAATGSDPARDRAVRLWDELAETYDQVGVDFFGPAADGLIDVLDPQPGERAIDLGCGRGAVLLPLARRVGATGRAVGGDLSPRMVAACQALVREQELPGVDVRVVDAQSPDVDGLREILGRPADLVASSLVVFFLADPAAALNRWTGLLRSGGRLGIATFGGRDAAWVDVDGVFDPYLPPHLLDARTSGAAGPFASDSGVETLLERAGLVDPRTVTRRVSAHFTDAEHWYRFTMSVGQRMFWGFVPAERRGEVRAEAFARLSRAAADDGSITFWQDVRYTMATRP